MLDHGLEPEDRSVRGSLVLGLSKADVEALDVFEGNVGTFFPTSTPPRSLIAFMGLGVYQEEGPGPSPGDHCPTHSLRGPEASRPQFRRG